MPLKLDIREYSFSLTPGGNAHSARAVFHLMTEIPKAASWFWDLGNSRNIRSCELINEFDSLLNAFCKLKFGIHIPALKLKSYTVELVNERTSIMCDFMFHSSTTIPAGDSALSITTVVYVSETPD